MIGAPRRKRLEAASSCRAVPPTPHKRSHRGSIRNIAGEVAKGRAQPGVERMPRFEIEVRIARELLAVAFAGGAFAGGSLFAVLGVAGASAARASVDW